MANATPKETIVNGLVEGVRGRNGAEYALTLQIVRGFERGESSVWAMGRIVAFTQDATVRARLMAAVSQIISLNNQAAV